MRIGISDWLFRSIWSGEDIIRNAGRLKFKGIEFNVYESDAPITLDSRPDKLKHLAKVAAHYGVALPSLSTALHNEYSLTSADKNVRKRGEEIVLRMIEVAGELGAKKILIVPGHVSEDMPYDRAYAISQETLFRYAPIARRSGIIIGIENVWNKFPLSPLEFVRFLDEINHPSLRAYLDVGNARMAGYPEQWIRLLDWRLVGVHLKDMRVRAGNDYGAVPYFQGDVNWPAVMRSLHEVNYRGYLMATPPASSLLPEEVVKAAAHDLKAMMEFL